MTGETVKQYLCPIRVDSLADSVIIAPVTYENQLPNIHIYIYIYTLTGIKSQNIIRVCEETIRRQLV
jgi:hypothetical protein